MKHFLKFCLVSPMLFVTLAIVIAGDFMVAACQPILKWLDR